MCVFTLPIVSPVLGDDYSTTSTRLLLNFDICDSSACVKLSVMNDSIAENVESFNITLEMTYPRIRLESVHGVVTIVDDDGMCMHTSKEDVCQNYRYQKAPQVVLRACNNLPLPPKTKM